MTDEKQNEIPPSGIRRVRRGCMFGAVAHADEPAKSRTWDERAADRAIDRGLAYLASVQLTDQSAREIKTKQTVRVPNSNRRLPAKQQETTETNALPELAGSIAINKPGSTGITSLALMAFLAKGHVPGRGPYGEVLNRGIDYLLSQQHDEKRARGVIVCRDRIGQAAGRGSGMMYEHCMSTLLLAEVSGMVDARRQEKLRPVLARALALILDGRNSSRKSTRWTEAAGAICRSPLRAIFRSRAGLCRRCGPPSSTGLLCRTRSLRMGLDLFSTAMTISAAASNMCPATAWDLEEAGSASCA